MKGLSGFCFKCNELSDIGKIFTTFILRTFSMMNRIALISIIYIFYKFRLCTAFCCRNTFIYTITLTAYLIITWRLFCLQFIRKAYFLFFFIIFTCCFPSRLSFYFTFTNLCKNICRVIIPYNKHQK